MGKDAFVAAYILIVAEIAHRAAQIACDNGIQPDDEMANTDRMGERNSRKFQARITDKAVQFEQSVHRAHYEVSEHDGVVPGGELGIPAGSTAFSTAGQPRRVSGAHR